MPESPPGGGTRPSEGVPTYGMMDSGIGNRGFVHSLLTSTATIWVGSCRREEAGLNPWTRDFFHSLVTSSATLGGLGFLGTGNWQLRIFGLTRCWPVRVVPSEAGAWVRCWC